LTTFKPAATIAEVYRRRKIAMRIPRALVAMMAALVVATGGLLIAVRASDAQMNGGSFRALIAALNADDQAAVQVHLAENFQLSFSGGSTLTGDEAVQVLMLLDTPVDIVSVTPGGQQKGTAVLTFGNAPEHYTVDYTGARGSRIATMSVSAPSGAPSQD
jgi:hypothetical protein